MFVLKLFTVIVFVPLIASLSPKEYPYLKTQINDDAHAQAFNKLLNSIVKVNQKRMDAIKKLNKLQATDLYPTLEDTLRADTTRRESDESDSSDSEENNIIYLVIPETSAANRTERVPSNAQNNSNLVVKRKPDPQRIYTPDVLEPNRAHDFSKIRGANDSITHMSNMSISRDGLDALRQNIERSCKSGQRRKCKRACIAASKSACDIYDCRKKLKRKFRKACKRECKSEFNNRW